MGFWVNRAQSFTQIFHRFCVDFCMNSLKTLGVFWFWFCESDLSMWPQMITKINFNFCRRLGLLHPGLTNLVTPPFYCCKRFPVLKLPKMPTYLALQKSATICANNCDWSPPAATENFNGKSKRPLIKVKALPPNSFSSPLSRRRSKSRTQF